MGKNVWYAFSENIAISPFFSSSLTMNINLKTVGFSMCILKIHIHRDPMLKCPGELNDFSIWSILELYQFDMSGILLYKFPGGTMCWGKPARSLFRSTNMDTFQSKNVIKGDSFPNKLSYLSTNVWCRGGIHSCCTFSAKPICSESWVSP